MKLLIVNEKLAAFDARYRCDALALAGVIDPNDVDGHELDLFGALTRAGYRIPSYPVGTVIQVSPDAMDMLRRQASSMGARGFHDGENLTFRGLPIVIVEQP